MTDENRQFGRWVAERRKAADLTQTSLGAAIGLDPSAITRMESGERKTSLDEVAALIRIFGVVPDLLRDACLRCGGFPPQGFTCNTCGAGDPQLAEYARAGVEGW